jgi:ABC-type Na+ efflux pump permease subunit
VQALLIWIWFVLHAKRLHDAGRAAGLAAGVSVLYALSIALLVVVAASFYGALAGQVASDVPDANAASALGLILVLSIIAILLGAPHFDLAWLMVAILLSLAFVPIVLAVATTFWAATRPIAQPIDQPIDHERSA